MKTYSIVFSTWLLLSAHCYGQNVWLRSAPEHGEWRQDENWSLGLPVSSQHVEVNHPSSAAFTRLRQLPGGVEVASLHVARGQDTHGEVRFTNGSLRIARHLNEPFTGTLCIGEAGGSARFLQKNSSLYVDDSIIIGDGNRTSGVLRVEDGSVLDCGCLEITGATSAFGKLVVCGDAIVSTREFVVGPGTAYLHLVAGARAAPVHTDIAPVLAGRLKVNLLNLVSPEDEIILIDNLDSEAVRGGFEEVCIINPDHGFYELTYAGGDGNDVSLRRSALPVNKYDRWTALHFGLDDPASARAPMADPDLDGLVNSAEYAMGRSPLQDEGPWLAKTTGEDAGMTDTTLVYSIRSDRKDARLVPQAKPPAGIWQSGLIESTNFATGIDTTTVVATARTPGEPQTRLFPELLPDVEQLNVLFLIADDMSNWVGCLNGHPQAQSPNIDRLAARGMLFRQAHAAATICNPSRVSILTGVPPSASGVYRNPQEFRLNRVLASAETLPGYFRGNGYLSVGSGKIFHDPDAASWDDYWPSIKHYRPRDPRPPVRHFNGITTRGKNFDWGPLAVSDEEMSDHKVASYIGDRLTMHPEGDPFFFGCGLFLPHLPFFAPQKYFDRFDADTLLLPQIDPFDLDDLPAAALATINFEDHSAVELANQWKPAVHAYLASIAFTDEQVGRVLDYLDDSPHGRNTIIVFLSDHGFSLGEKVHWRKQALWNRITHVPMIIVAPGTTMPGSVCDSPVSLIDVFPTLVDLCDLPALAQLRGRSLKTLLLDPAIPTEQPVLTTRYRLQHSIQNGRFHFIQYPDGERELYDLWSDPHEWENLAEERASAGVIDSLSTWLPTQNARSHP